MHTELYLDTARLGRMCPAACRAEQQFAQLVSQAGCTLYFEQFLAQGVLQLPRRMRRGLTHLAHWRGVSELKSRLRQFVGLPASRPIWLASRTSQLMKLAAHCLCMRCERILATDMEWPPYLEILRRIAWQRKRSIYIVPLKKLVVLEGAHQKDVTERLQRAYLENHCDGLLLSAVTYFGLRLPIAAVLSALNDLAIPRFVVIDGAQALNHLPLTRYELGCDLFLTGTQKWLQAFLPLGIAIAGRASSADWIAAAVDHLRHTGLVDDPLLEFSASVESAAPQPFGETVNVTPMITASAALAAAMRPGSAPEQRWSARLANAARVSDLLPTAKWRRANECPFMGTAAVLVQSQSPDSQVAPAIRLRQQFASFGISLSAYECGKLRLSLPSRPLDQSSLRRLRRAFAQC